MRIGLIRNLTSIFSKTTRDRPKRFSPRKTTIQRKQISRLIFIGFLHSEVNEKLKQKLLRSGKTEKVWYLSSVATLESHGSETRGETKCYKYKRITRAVILEWFLTMRAAAITPRISIFTLALPKNRAFF